MGKILFSVCCVATLFVSAFLSARLNSKSFNPCFILFFVISCFCFHNLFQKKPSSKEMLWSALFSLVFGEAVAIGNTVRYSEMRSAMDQNTLSLSISTLLTGVLLAFLLVPAVITLSRIVNKTRFPEKTGEMKHFYLLAWGLIFLGWIPWLLAWYPGGIVGDGAIVLEEALQGSAPSSNHLVVCYILVIRLFTSIGRLILPGDISGIQLGVFFYVLAACAFVSSALAAVISFVYRRGMPAWMCWIFISLFSLTGFFVSHASSLWKDATFSAGVVWLSLLIWKISENGKPNWKQIVQYAVVALFLCFWRNNGVWVLLLTAAGLLLLMGWKNTKKILIVTLTVMIVFFVVTGPIYKMLGIKNDGLVQSVSVPLQQVAACVNSNVPMSDAQQETLYQILSPEDWAKYCPTLSDDLKNSLDPNKFKDQFGGLLSVWAQLLIPNLKTYIRAYLMLMLGFWQPFCWQGNYFDYWLGIQDLYGRGYQRVNMLNGLGSKTLGVMVDTGNVWFISSGTMVWLMFLSVALILMQPGYRRIKLLPFVPLFASWVVIMIASPIAYAYRYILMIPMMLPALVFLPICHISGKTKAESDDSESRTGRRFKLWKKSR